MTSPAVRAVEINDDTFEGPHGPLAIRVYAPANPIGSGLVWVHGGAWVGGDLEMLESHATALHLAQRGVTIVTVDYRLAPAITAFGQPPRDGVHFPIASEEVSAALSWAQERYSQVRWSLGGASAGANLAAGAVLRARDLGDSLPESVVLVYPLVHRELPEAPKELQEKLAKLPADRRHGLEGFLAITRNYVGDPVNLDHPYAFPGGHDLTGYPRTFILNSDADVLRPSGEAFAHELIAFGVEVTVVREDGAAHGHLDTPDTVEAQLSYERIARWLTAEPLSR